MLFISKHHVVGLRCTCISLKCACVTLKAHHILVLCLVKFYSQEVFICTQMRGVVMADVSTTTVAP